MTSESSGLVDLLRSTGAPDDAIWTIVQQREQEREFEREFTNTFLSWQKLERLLFVTLLVLMTSVTNLRLLSALFHAVMSLDARLGMVSAVAQLQLQREHPNLWKEWTDLVDVIRKEAKKRNRMAHFSLHDVSVGKNVGLRLKPSEWDLRPSTADFGASDLRKFGRDFAALEAKMSAYLMKVHEALNKKVR